MKFENKIPISITIGGKDVNKIRINGEVVWQKVEPVDADYFYVENTYSGSNTITFTTTQSGTPASGTYATSVECSKDKLTWNTINFDTLNPQTITLEQGEKLYLRNDTGVFNFHDVRNGTVDYYTSITSTNTINVGGNTNSLFDYTNMSGVDVSSTVGGLSRLFNQSVNLINAKDIVIPQTTYPDFFVDEMFNHCESLVTTPNLNNVVNIGYASCSQMFGYCYSLVTPPDFNSVVYTGPRSGFSWTFYDCTSLTRTPSFNSLTSIGPLGFNKAFTNCSNLTDIMFDTSNITSLPESAFNQSFMNTKIETGLHLGNVTELGKASLYNLYRDCSSLSVVYCPNVSSWDTSKTNNWLSGAGTSVSGTKTAYKYSDISIPTSDSGIPSGWTVVKPINYFYVKNEYDGKNDITFRAVRRPTETTIQQIEYSKDKINWTTETITANIVITIPLEKGEKVYFRNDNGYFSNNLTGTSAFRIKIRATQNHSIGGDITTLYNYSYKSGVTIPEGCFRYLFGCDLESLNSGNTFEGNPNLIDASQLILPEKSLSTGCYAGMFMLTRGLINPPQTIDCQSVGVESCHRMFKGSGITTTPSLSAKSIGTNGCTEMFMECNNITTMPTLQATSLGEYCFSYMFSNCVNLGGTITLPATTTAQNCYSGMFESTAITGAIIKAKTLKKNCMTTMFENCSNLNEVTVYATATSPTNLMISGITSHWLSGVASTGTFRNLGSITFDTDSVSGVPVGWTVVTE